MKKMTLVALVLSIMGCTDKPDDVKATLDKFGMTYVDVGGWSVFGCGKLSWNHTKFVAIRSDGIVVEGVVCTGFFIDTTISYKGQ